MSNATQVETNHDAVTYAELEHAKNTGTRATAIGLTILLALSSNAFASKITPEEIYTSFNLRSIYSSLGNNLGYYCASYLSDIFPSDTVTLKKNTLIIDSKNRFMQFVITSENNLIFYDKIKTGTYDTKAKITFSYDKQHRDFRSNETFIEVPNPCEPYPLQR